MPNPSADLASVYPNLTGTNAALSKDILGELQGELSPDVINQIKDQSAAWGVGSGVPGSGIQGNLSLRDLGLTSLNLRRQGVQDYASAIPTVSQTQTVRPETEAEIAATNAQDAAAPNPSAAAQYALSLFKQYMQPQNPANNLPYGGNYFTPAGSSTPMPYSAAFA